MSPPLPPVIFANKCLCCHVPELGVPSSVDLVCSDPAHLVTSFTNGQIGLFNMETRQLVLTLESPLEPGKHRLRNSLFFIHEGFHQTLLEQPILM